MPKDDLPERLQPIAAAASTRQPEQPSSPTPSVWLADTAEVRAMQIEGPTHPADLVDRLERCRAAYFYPDDHRTQEGRERALEIFTQALIGIPANFVALSFDEWLGRMPRWPSPADIANRARELQGAARDRMRIENQCSAIVLARDEAIFGKRPDENSQLSEEERERRRRFVEELTRGTFLEERRAAAHRKRGDSRRSGSSQRATSRSGSGCWRGIG